MESVAMENCPLNVDENQDVKGSQSAENFQKFMYELFEKNGVMNDLRSYLRGHIVNVLRSAQTGDPPSCQKHFTQRLELTFQALNILIAEYLLRLKYPKLESMYEECNESERGERGVCLINALEFSYTLSVFVSEIPLANMVFSFAKTLMKKVDNDDSRPRFTDSDVWCILNYLGVKCDSEHASSIVEMYRLERNSPLLLCILKTAPLFKEPIVIDQLNSSQDSLSSQKSSGSEKTRCPSKPSVQEKCRHYVFCKTCQSKMMRIKDKYKRKKKEIAKNLKESSLHSLNVDSLMKNISFMERSLIDEMFDQLKSVYEAEMELLKQEEDRRVKKSLVSHTTQLQKRREEMEESFKAREAELEENVQQKKRFLWGLARALREQHQHMTRAMHDVRAETTRLTDKENSLKAQLAEAEQVLRQRGEDMRLQITEELTILEGHLENMKRERDNIDREREQLERYKDTSHIEIEDLKPHYDLLKSELTILKKYLETAKLQPKCVIERGTLTEPCDMNYVTNDVITRDVTTNEVMTRGDVTLNNEQHIAARGQPKQLVNDLKKPKNVNFSQSNLDEVYRERSRSRSRSSASSEAGDALFLAERDSNLILREENEQLRCFARQQRQHIDSLSLQQARLQAELTAARVTAPVAPGTSPPPLPPLPPPPLPLRPRTAPTVATYTLDAHNQRLSASASVNNFSFGWKKGAGEELCLFNHDHPRVILPGTHVPFIGRHTDNRRYLINQWRTLRRRMSPLSGGITKPRVTTLQRNLERPDIAGPSIRLHLNQIEDVTQPNPEGYRPPERTREKSPKSVLREAKENLRNNETKDHPPTKREKSPNCVLREAKMRLRKLEIEAEAVEKSYLDFRRKQDSFRGDIDKKETINTETKPSTSYKLDETYTKESTSRYQAPVNDYDKYFKEYQTKIDFSDHFKNKNTAVEIMKPIPNAFSTQKPKTDFIETPLTEFRKYYQTERFHNETNVTAEDTNKKGTRKELIRQAKHDKIKELELLKHNIGKIYNMPEQAIVETPTNEEIEVDSKDSKENEQTENAVIETKSNAKNLLRIEVESVSEINDLKPTESQDLLLIVESSVDTNRDTDIENDKEMVANQMTIIISPKSISPTRTNSEIINPKAETISEKSEIKTRNESITESLTPRKASIKSSKKGSITSERISPRKMPNSGPKSEKYDHLTTDDVVAFYHSDNDRSSVQMKLEISKELDNTISELEQHEDPDYPDDFSADVDNYNSRSDIENNSPISLPKTSEDENFWDS